MGRLLEAPLTRIEGYDAPRHHFLYAVLILVQLSKMF